MNQEMVDKIKKAVDILSEVEKETSNPRFQCGILCHECNVVAPHRYKQCHFYRDLGSAVYYGSIAYRSAKNLLEYEKTGKEELKC